VGDWKHMKGIVLPNSDNVVNIEEQSLIIIGANGAGKSRLGAYIELNNDFVHRISAQRSLKIPELIEMTEYKQALKKFYYGNTNYGDEFINPDAIVWKLGVQNKIGMRRSENDSLKPSRWNNGEYTTTLLNDYEEVLSALVSKQNRTFEEYVKKCKEKEANGLPHDDAPKSEIDKIVEIWNYVFEHLTITFEDGEILVNRLQSEYHAKEMSDGERVALYFMAQCLCIPKDSIIIIDEPEAHLHRSVMNKLWSKLENERRDCLFIYITHDIEFASCHENSRKLWVYEYLGNGNWKYEFVNDSNDVPEELLLEILGTRKNILFVEGKRESLDYSLYQHFYYNYSVIPCESCLKVIESTKSLRKHTQLHHLSVLGLVDRDYRTDEEIQKLRKDGIYTLDIAEVENLFIIEEIYMVIVERLVRNKSDVEQAKEFVINLFEKCLEVQIKNAVVSEIKYKLNVYDVNKNSKEQIKKAVDSISESIKVDEIFNVKTEQFNKLKEERIYANILKFFNKKELYKSVGSFFGLKNDDYPNFVIRLLQSDARGNIIEALKKYLPEL
jgi:hypothetical protein